MAEQMEIRLDGYTNLINKYGTTQDNSTRYGYSVESMVSDMELVRLYEGDGLFSKIIDRPAEEAVKHGLNIDFGDGDIMDYVEQKLDDIGYEDKFATAEKWARLFGGALIVMLVNDGGGLESPLNMDKADAIEELRVYERALVEPDYQSILENIREGKDIHRFGEPIYYTVNSRYGTFKVHYSRCLVFRNGRLPEYALNETYRYWGVPEYVKIRKALMDCEIGHADGVKLLERSAQAIYKMKNLANLLATAEGENKVLNRLQVIDMARNILNSIAIDNDGEDYDFKNLSLAGVKDVIDSTCNMLSAVTNIPQTVLFGSSPTGENSTGESDLENYYNLVENIQKQNMKANTRTIVDLILKQGVKEGTIADVPKYKMEFAALWSMTDEEQLSMDSTKAAIAKTKAETANTYLQAGVLDPQEVRRALAEEGDFIIEEILDDADLMADFDDSEVTEQEMIMAQELNHDWREDDQGDTKIGTGVLIIKDGKFLVGERTDNHQLCGPGGHKKKDETIEQAAFRETMEEFGIAPLNMISLGQTEEGSHVFICDKFSGSPKADNDEMMDARFMAPEDLLREDLFTPFRNSLSEFIKFTKGKFAVDRISDDDIMNEDGGDGSGNWGHKGRPGVRGGSAPGAKWTTVTSSRSFKNKLVKAKNSQDPDKAWRVDSTGYSLKDYNEHTKFVTDGGSTVSVHNGDIVSVCKNKGDKATGRALLMKAVNNGGDRLDSYEGNHRFYIQNGFEPVSWCKWDIEFKPPGWEPGRDKPEDIIFYKYTGKRAPKGVDAKQALSDFKKKVSASAGYFEAQTVRDNAIGG